MFGSFFASISRISLRVTFFCYGSLFTFIFILFSSAEELKPHAIRDNLSADIYLECPGRIILSVLYMMFIRPYTGRGNFPDHPRSMQAHNIAAQSEYMTCRAKLTSLQQTIALSKPATAERQGMCPGSTPRCLDALITSPFTAVETFCPHLRSLFSFILTDPHLQFFHTAASTILSNNGVPTRAVSCLRSPNP